jgi:U2 small nuclear ribonucleoprotein A'
MKLTPELLAQAPSALNPVKERELNLRGVWAVSLLPHRANPLPPGHKIPAIENLGVTRVRQLLPS